jgi:hypothetical protein
MEGGTTTEPKPWEEAKNSKRAPWEPEKKHVRWDNEAQIHHQTWLPEWDQEGDRKARQHPTFPTFDPRQEIPPTEGGTNQKGWWQQLQKRVVKRFGDALDGLRQTERKEKERLLDPESNQPAKRKKKITPSNYSAMEIHGFFGLVDDGPCGQGRMLICHVPSWVRGQFMDVKDGDQVHVWNVNGRGGGVLDVLFTGRHRYYSPGSKITTCTICVPEEQWARVLNLG